jgi:hypothetical protein
MLLIIIPFYFINGTAQVRLNALFEAVIRTSHFLAILVGYRLAGVEGVLYGLIVTTFINIPFQYFYFHRKVLACPPDFQFILVVIPVLCMLGFVQAHSGWIQTAMVACFALSLKFIYYDPARHHARGISAFRGIFARLALK